MSGEPRVSTQVVNGLTEAGSGCAPRRQGPIRGHASTPPSYVSQVTTVLAIFQAGPSDPAACWEWPGPRDTDGYGRAIRGKRYRRAHRVSYELANGPIPAGLCVLHRCDNRPCVRPSHLFLGTRRDNALDKTLKRRVRHGRHGLPFGVGRQSAGGPRPYQARIRENGKCRYLGVFATIEEAAAVAAAERERRAARIRIELTERDSRSTP